MPRYPKIDPATFTPEEKNLLDELNGMTTAEYRTFSAKGTRRPFNPNVNTARVMLVSKHEAAI